MAQKGHAIPQPAWEDTHIVTRSGYLISTDSTRAPSKSRHSVLRVVPPSAARVRTGVSSAGISSATKEWRSRTGMSVIRSTSSTSREK